MPDRPILSLHADLQRLKRLEALLAEARKLLAAIQGVGYSHTLTGYKRQAAELVGRIDKENRL